MNTLTEDTIKKKAIVFLKNYYKHRPRTSPTTAKLDLKSFGGIIVDGKLTFQTDEKKEFVATLEATSIAKKDEVIYKPLNLKLFWYSIATALSLIATLYIFGFAENYFSITNLGLGGGLTAVFALLFAVYFLAKSFLSPYSRFKYIYAIEQFKRYHADEQWIAIADDLFDNPDNPYFIELKKQCVSQGIGLLEIDEELNVQAVITAAREQVSVKERQRMAFFGEKEIVETQPQRFKKGIKKVFSKLKPSMKPGAAFLRYRRSNINQFTIASVAFCIISVFIYFEYEAMGPAYVNEKKYAEELEKLAENAILETPTYLVDSIGETPFDAKYEPFDFINQSEPQSEPVSVINPVEEEVIVRDQFKKELKYDCERLYNFAGELFMIQLTLHESVINAERQMSEFNALGVKANVIWLGCFEGNETRYAVYHEALYPKKVEVMREARNLKDLFDKIQEDVPIAIRRIYFENNYN